MEPERSDGGGGNLGRGRRETAGDTGTEMQRSTWIYSLAFLSRIMIYYVGGTTLSIFRFFEIDSLDIEGGFLFFIMENNHRIREQAWPATQTVLIGRVRRCARGRALLGEDINTPHRCERQSSNSRPRPRAAAALA